jgi:hypothetical protein
MTTELEARFDKAIQDANFNVFEIQGFMGNPSLAVKAGIAIGYRMGMDDTMKEFDVRAKAVKQ